MESPIFGIISEGISDFTVLRNFLSGYFEDKTIDVRQLQPENGELPFGWGNLFNYLDDPGLKDAFSYVDYLIIQIDTDTAQDWGHGAVPNKTEELIEWVKEILINKISEDKYEPYKDRILFAVADKNIECWILSFHATTAAHKVKDTGCLKTLNSQYLSKKGYTIDPDAKAAKELRFFEKASSVFLEKKKFKQLKTANKSLLIFIEDLNGKFNS